MTHRLLRARELLSFGLTRYSVGSFRLFWSYYMPLTPLHDRVIVKREEAETKTTGGILLPDTAKNKPQKGTVTAVGPGKPNKDGKVTPLQVKVGDKVLFTVWAGEEYK